MLLVLDAFYAAIRFIGFNDKGIHVNEELNKFIEELKNHFTVLGRGHEVFSRIELRLISEYFLNKIESIKNVPD